jgi:MFS family permease
VERSRRNVLLLALCQAASLSTASLMATIGTLAGHDLASDKSLATLPATALTVGTALGTIPASLLTRRAGRRLAFIVGSGLTMAGGLVGAWAVVVRSFWLLSGGGFLLGGASAFAQL